MTGSAGTAMDVLVTCFSKMGGESERRGWKYRAPLVISMHFMDSFSGLLFSRFSFSPNVSKTQRLPYFQSLRSPPLGSISGFLSEGFFDVFSSLWRVKKLQKYGRHARMSYGGKCSYLLSILSHNAKSMAGAILEGHLRTQKNMFFDVFQVPFFYTFWKSA